MNEEEKRTELQKEMLRSFKEGIKRTFVAELAALTISKVFSQPSSFILQYGAFNLLTILFL